MVDNLNQSGLGVYLRDALTLVLEVRMENPLAFLALYFRTAARAVSGNTSHVAQAFRTLVVCLQKPVDHQMYAAFTKVAIDNLVPVEDFHCLVNLLLCDLPISIAGPTIDRLSTKIGVTFPAFRDGMEACLFLCRFRLIARKTFAGILHRSNKRPPLTREELFSAMEESIKNSPFPCDEEWRGMLRNRLPEGGIGVEVFMVAVYGACQELDKDLQDRGTLS